MYLNCLGFELMLFTLILFINILISQPIKIKNNQKGYKHKLANPNKSLTEIPIRQKINKTSKVDLDTLQKIFLSSIFLYLFARATYYFSIIYISLPINFC